MAKFFTLQTAALKVDRDKRRINGIAIASKTPDANGDVVDDQSLQMFAGLGNASTIRARFDHPNRADPTEVEQTLEKLLGEHTNFRIEDDTLRADCQMAGVNLDLENKVMDFAEKTPHLFGVSVVFDETPPPKGQKPKKHAPCRPVRFFAGDFVDIPAANAAGLFAATAAESDKSMDAEVYAKDGKCYATIDGKEVELKHSKEAIDALQKPADKTDDDEDDDDEKAEAKKKAAKLAEAPVITAEDLEKAKTAAVEGEKTYRKMFATAVKSAKMSDAEAEEFETEFYGRPEKDVKFLASKAIGTRAKAVGGNSGTPEPTGEEKDKEQEKAEAEIKTYCTKRLNAEALMRRTFGVNTANPEDPTFKAGLTKFMAVEKKSRADWATPVKKAEGEGDDKEEQSDCITKLFAKKNVFATVG